MDQIALFIASIIANTMSAFAGGGAGLVQLPIILLLGLPFPIALATHKLVTVALGIGAFTRFKKEKSIIEMKFALFILFFGMLGAISGAFLIVQTPDDIAKTLLAFLIIGLGIYSLFKK